jgi:hypothetical protein
MDFLGDSVLWGRPRRQYPLFVPPSVPQSDTNHWQTIYLRYNGSRTKLNIWVQRRNRLLGRKILSQPGIPGEHFFAYANWFLFSTRYLL